ARRRDDQPLSVSLASVTSITSVASFASVASNASAASLASPTSLASPSATSLASASEASLAPSEVSVDTSIGDASALVGSWRCHFAPAPPGQNATIAHVSRPSASGPRAESGAPSLHVVAVQQHTLPVLYVLPQSSPSLGGDVGHAGLGLGAVPTP